MSKSNNLSDFLTDIADAIRFKKGTSGTINAQNFSTEIASIQTGITPARTYQERTWTPTNLTSQTIPAGTYCEGKQTIQAITPPSALSIRKGSYVYGTSGRYGFNTTITDSSGIYDIYSHGDDGGIQIEIGTEDSEQITRKIIATGWNNNGTKTTKTGYIEAGRIQYIYFDANEIYKGGIDITYDFYSTTGDEWIRIVDGFTLGDVIDEVFAVGDIHIFPIQIGAKTTGLTEIKAVVINFGDLTI